VERPASGSHIDFDSFAHWARTAERGTLDLLFWPKDCDCATEAEPYSTRT